MLFLQTHHVDFNDESVALFKGEHLNNPEMPGKTVPTLVVTSPPGGDGKKRYICQSTTILRYLATHHTKEGHWYTGSDDIRFKVDEFFDYWQVISHKPDSSGIFFREKDQNLSFQTWPKALLTETGNLAFMCTWVSLYSQML